MNLELVEQIVALLGDYPVSEIAVELENCRVHVRRPPSGIASVATQTETALFAAPATPESGPGKPAEEMRVLTAPMVGIFYHTQPPLPFAAEITPGQIVGSIESMKLMNDVTADEGGRIVDILVEDGAPVDYGRALFHLAAH